MIFKQIIRAIIYYPALLTFLILAFVLEAVMFLWDIIIFKKPEPDVDGFKMILGYLNPVIYIKYIKHGG